jgi:glycosyltransferase involved in cell wall biosynthesis
LGETLVKFGHQVSVVTGLPRYNMESMPAEYRGRAVCRETTNGMDVWRIATPETSRGSRIRRGFGHLAVAPLYALRGLRLRKVDVVYTVSPPLPMGLAASAVATRFGARFVLGVQDLFPQNAIDLGLMKNRTLIGCFEAMERFVYARATSITVHSEGNREHVAARTKNPAKVHVLPNWVDTEFIRPAGRSNSFRELAGLNGEFVVLFAGTMGRSQGLDVAMDAARRLAGEPGLVFLMVGDGSERGRLESMAAGLPNVRFLPMQPKNAYPELLATADACLVTLATDVKTPVVPSKLLTIMAAERPVLASLPLTGDAPRIISDSGCGIAVEGGDARGLAEAALALKRDPALAGRMARNGRRTAETEFSREACIRRFETVFQGTAEKSL